IGIAVWLAGGVLTELAGRVGFGKHPLDEVGRRLIGLPRSAWGMTFAHFGLAIFILGATAMSLWQAEKILVMKSGQTAEVGGYDVTFNGVQDKKGPNYVALRGLFVAKHGNSTPLNLIAEKRRYVVGGQETTEAAIHNSWRGDLYIVIGDTNNEGGQTVRLYFMPLVNWIWLGTLVMVLGGFISLSDRRLRVGAPTRKSISDQRGAEATPAE
ncbi:MAG: cytochrome c-type biogenesis CcmF C-terminal domain-containing protein, partial [Alphaproteobacteria bacterium]